MRALQLSLTRFVPLGLGVQSGTPNWSGNPILEREGLGNLVVFASVSCLAMSAYSADLLLPASVLDYWVIGFALAGETMGIWFLRSGFRTFSKIDAGKFSNPSKFVTCLLLGLPLILVGYAVLIGWGSSLREIAANPYVVPHLGALAEGEVLVLTGIAFGLVGAGGAISGLWRLGERYRSNALKLSSIFLIFPYADIISVLLLFFGTLSIRSHIERRGTDSLRAAIASGSSH